MSLILDALDKADRQRDTQDAVPDLQTVHPELKSADYAVVPIWALFALVCLLLTVIMVLLFFLVKSQSPQYDFHATGHEMEYHAEFDQPDIKADSELFQVENDLNDYESQQYENEEVGSVKPEVETLYHAPSALKENTLVGKVAAKVAEQDEAPIKASQANSTRDPQIEKLYSQKESLLSQASKENTKRTKTNTARAERLSQQSVPSASNTTPLVSDQELQDLWKETQKQVDDKPSEPANPYANIPFLHQLPESFQERIPTLMYQNHIYSPKASAVIINGKTYRKGDTIAADLVIDEITQEALILTYLKKPFQLAALSSWVQG